MGEPLRPAAAERLRRVEDLCRSAHQAAREDRTAESVDLLAGEFYRLVHCHLPHRGARTDPAEGVPLGEQLEAAASLLAGMEEASQGWSVEHHDGGNTTLTSAEGVSVRVPTTAVAPPLRDGDTWTLHSLPLGLDAGGRWMHWSPALPLSAPRIYRIYVAAEARNAVPLWGTIIRAAAAHGLPVRTKLATSRGGVDRSDTMVFYVSEPEVPHLLDRLDEVDGELLADRTAGFSYPVRPGIGLGAAVEDAQAARLVSFGYHWAHRYAEAALASLPLDAVSRELAVSWKQARRAAHGTQDTRSTALGPAHG